MIMSIIYRNVPRKKVNEMMLLGEQISAEDAVTYGLANKVVPADEFEGAVDEWAAKLASKSPVLMRLGHDAMYRQQDMALDDALEFLRSQLSLTFSTEDIQEGVKAFFEKREPDWKGRDERSKRPRPRTCSARRERRSSAAARRRSPSSTSAASSRPASGSSCSATRARSWRWGSTARPHSSQRAMEGVEAPADGVITGWGDVDGKTCCIAAYDFTVMAGSMGMTGEIKVGRLREMALNKRMPFIWLLDSAGARIQEAAGLDVRRLGPPVPRGGRDVGRGPDGRRDARALRRRDRLHPGPLGLRADGRRPGRDGARRART